MKTKHNKTLLLFFLAVMMMGFALESAAQDWPVWRGVDRHGVYHEANLNLDWTTQKPPILWTYREAGSGYASPAIVGTTLYCQGGSDGNDFAFALDTKTGNLKWKQNLGPEHTAYQNRGNSARGSITVDGNKLYLIRADGIIHCLAAADGKMLWQKDFIKDFGGKIMSGWGFSESPLVDGNLVICTPGGSGGTMVALDKNSGEVVWRSTEWTDDAGYSSPIVVEVDGIRQYVQQSGKGFAGVAAKDGKLLWKIEVEIYRTAIIPTPVPHGNLVYVTAGYNGGCHLVRLTKSGNGCNAEVVYANKNMVNQHGGVSLLNGYVYGFTDGMGFVCQDFTTGEIAWRERVPELLKGATLAVNDRILLQNERDGLIALVAASSDGWKEYGRMEFPERTDIVTQDKMIWTHPVVSDGKLYLRDHNLLFCFDLKK